MGKFLIFKKPDFDELFSRCFFRESVGKRLSLCPFGDYPGLFGEIIPENTHHSAGEIAQRHEINFSD